MKREPPLMMRLDAIATRSICIRLNLELQKQSMRKTIQRAMEKEIVMEFRIAAYFLRIQRTF